MSANSIDAEFSKYWAQLIPIRKQALLTFIQSFYGQEKSSTKIVTNELQEPGAEYNVPWKIFQSLSKQQKKALINVLQSSGMDPANRVSIDQYNKEIDEALEEYKAGNFITQEEMEKFAAKWPE